MRAFVGLGNPGSEYEGTRHNIGFAVLDAVAEQYRLRFREGKGEYLCAAHGDCLLVKPTTYMNNSGVAVREILERFEVPLEGTFVVFDDVHLPLGTLRIRRRGSSGGHNGVASILWQAGSDEFPRLRCGIGSLEQPVDQRALAGFVLSRFGVSEMNAVQTMVERARDVTVVAMQNGVQPAIDFLSKQKI